MRRRVEGLALHARTPPSETKTTAMPLSGVAGLAKLTENSGIMHLRNRRWARTRPRTRVRTMARAAEKGKRRN